jgi:hypothetical protein
MSLLSRRVKALEAGTRTPCPACSPEALRPVIKWPGQPPSPPTPEACPACGRDLRPWIAAVRAIRWPVNW